MTAPNAGVIHCPICQRKVELSAGVDEVSSGRCACGVRLVVIETPAEDGLPVRQVVAQRQALRTQRIGQRAHRR